MAQQFYFSDFMKHLVAQLHEENLALPLKDERPWHELFYQLKECRELGSARPAFLDNLRFDWDGPYPKCQQVSEFLHALHWNAGVSGMNPSYTTMTLPQEIADLWGQRRASLPGETRQALERVVDIARQQFMAS